MTNVSRYNTVDHLRTHEEVNGYLAACFELVLVDGDSFDILAFVAGFLSDATKALDNLNKGVS